MRDWYRRGDNAEKQRLSQIESRNRRLEQVRAYDRARGKEKKTALKKDHPEKWAARRYVVHAVYMGRMTRQPCEVCGEHKTEGHHPDYSKPKEVVWLCHKHHMELHRPVAA
jgi:hypothetical protein